MAAAAIAVGLAGCSSGDTSEQGRQVRGTEALRACEDNGGVVGFDDDSVICADQTFNDQRGSNAVQACRDRGGVTAFDDDIVICGDRTFHEAAGG